MLDATGTLDQHSATPLPHKGRRMFVIAVL